MTATETQRFYLATETISGGYIIADPYAPAINVIATGVPGTTGYVGYIEPEGEYWHSLGAVTVNGDGTIDATLFLEPGTTYSGYFAINHGSNGTQFIAGPLTFTTAPAS